MIILNIHLIYHLKIRLISISINHGRVLTKDIILSVGKGPFYETLYDCNTLKQDLDSCPKEADVENLPLLQTSLLYSSPHVILTVHYGSNVRLSSVSNLQTT